MTMKLYFSPGACSLASHIALTEAGVPFEVEKVNIREKKLSNGDDYFAVNPKGAVPALKMENGEVLTEGAVILQYIADQKPESKLIPAAGTPERYRAQEWLNYVASEVHKTFSPLFRPDTPDAQKAQVKEMLAKKFDFVVKQLGNKSYLLGDTFTVPDAYLFTMLTWAKNLHVDVPATLATYRDRVAARPAVAQTLAAETAARA